METAVRKSIGGLSFAHNKDYDQSDLLNHLLGDQDVKRAIYDHLRAKGIIVFDKETKRWSIPPQSIKDKRFEAEKERNKKQYDKIVKHLLLDKEVHVDDITNKTKISKFKIKKLLDDPIMFAIHRNKIRIRTLEEQEELKKETNNTEEMF